MTVREDALRRADGSDGIYGFVDKPDFVIILPIDKGLVHLVEQYRYPIKRRQWELPQGNWETAIDVAAEEVAKGELKEETGLTAGTMIAIGELYPLDGTVTQKFRAFLATDLTSGTRSLDQEEQDLVTRAFPLAEFEDMILKGEIEDASTVATLVLARLRKLI